MFRDFAASAGFPEAVTQTRPGQTSTPRTHRKTVSGIGEILCGTAGFTGMDDRNTAKPRAARCSSAT